MKEIDPVGGGGRRRRPPWIRQCICEELTQGLVLSLGAMKPGWLRISIPWKIQIQKHVFLFKCHWIHRDQLDPGMVF